MYSQRSSPFSVWNVWIFYFLIYLFIFFLFKQIVLTKRYLLYVYIT
jgi:hypothetical protein